MQMSSSQYDEEVIIVAIETRHDLEGNLVPVAIDFERNEYICSWATLEEGEFNTEWMKRMQPGVRFRVNFKAMDRGGEITYVGPIEPKRGKQNND